MNSTALSGYDLPAPETPASDQPGGFGPFVRIELFWGRLRRAVLRRLFPGHVRYWLAKRRGDCERTGKRVIDPRDLKFIRSVSGCSFDAADDVYRRREQMGFARYGFAEFIGFSTILAIGSTAFSALAVQLHPLFFVLSTLCVLLWLEVVWFFRDPERMIPSDPRLVLSPADGTVSHVEIVDEPGMGPGTLRISIFLSIFNVHGNRLPRSATVQSVEYFRGRYLDARHADCAKQNEQLWLNLVDRDTGCKIRVKQISGAIARRICCWLRVGEDVKAGDRYGMIKFGSRTDLLMPANVVGDPLVKVGDKVRGGVTVLVKMADRPQPQHI